MGQNHKSPCNKNQYPGSCIVNKQWFGFAFSSYTRPILVIVIRPMIRKHCLCYDHSRLVDLFDVFMFFNPRKLFFSFFMMLNILI